MIDSVAHGRARERLHLAVGRQKIMSIEYTVHNRMRDDVLMLRFCWSYTSCALLNDHSESTCNLTAKTMFKKESV